MWVCIQYSNQIEILTFTTGNSLVSRLISLVVWLWVVMNCTASPQYLLQGETETYAVIYVSFWPSSILFVLVTSRACSGTHAKPVLLAPLLSPATFYGLAVMCTCLLSLWLSLTHSLSLSLCFSLSLRAIEPHQYLFLFPITSRCLRPCSNAGSINDP